MSLDTCNLGVSGCPADIPDLVTGMIAIILGVSGDKQHDPKQPEQKRKMADTTGSQRAG